MTTPTPSKATTLASPLEALERDEIMRTRRFCYIMFVFVALGVFATVAIPGDPVAALVLRSSMVVGFAAMAFLLYRTRDPVSFRKPSTGLLWFVPAIAVNAAVMFFGVFSPAPMLTVLGLYFVGLGQRWGIAFSAYVVCAVCHAVLGAISILDPARDVGIINVPIVGTYDKTIIHLLMQAVIGITVIAARLSRRATLIAVSELEQAVRVAAHRQALLLEAREDLERALRTGRGRFTEQVIGGYTLGNVLGRGAMGEVYDAKNTRTGERVAIKLLSQASLGNPQHILRFLRELRTAAGITSPHVVRVIEVGEAPVPYLVMERLEGVTLSELLRAQGTLSTPEVIALIAQIGAGITAAGEAGIVHRDLKPQNVFRHGTTWKVLDFGVARGIEHGDTLTAGHIVGTPSYMSPEQASGDTVDHKTDLYSLAAIAYRGLTGQPPFPAGEVADTLYRVVHTRPPRPTMLAPQLPADVDLVLAIGLARRPADRFSTATALATALEQALTSTLDPAVRSHGEAMARLAGWRDGARVAVPTPLTAR